MANNIRKNRVVAFVNSPVGVTVIAGLATALLGPFLIERTRYNITKHDAVESRQFEVVENLTRIAFKYYIDAEFLMLDFRVGQSNKEILSRHLADYDDVAKDTLSGFLTEAFKVRMYFGDPLIYSQLIDLWEKISRLDVKIIQLLEEQQNTPQPNIPQKRTPWVQLASELASFRSDAEILFNLIYKRIGGSPPTLVPESPDGTLED